MILLKFSNKKIPNEPFIKYTNKANIFNVLKELFKDCIQQ